MKSKQIKIVKFIEVDHRMAKIQSTVTLLRFAFGSGYGGVSSAEGHCWTNRIHPKFFGLPFSN